MKTGIQGMPAFAQVFLRTLGRFCSPAASGIAAQFYSPLASGIAVQFYSPLASGIASQFYSPLASGIAEQFICLRRVVLLRSFKVEELYGKFRFLYRQMSLKAPALSSGEFVL